ncbi:unnamed protein product, partial [Meganyctiphanes norvegica]
GGAGNVQNQAGPPGPPGQVVPSPGSGPCNCVPIQNCADPSSDPTSVQPSIGTNGAPVLDAVDPRRVVLNVDDRQASICGGAIQICCDNVRQDPGPPPPPPSVPRGSDECGIRSTNGVGVTITGSAFQNGQAQIGEFPWMVAVLDKANNYIGGASLVHPRVVLTAAHKVHDKVANNMVARIGDWDLSNTDEPIPLQNIDVAQMVLHPTFDRPTLVNDVALLILQRDAALSDVVMPICLPQPNTNFDFSSCIITGWGKDVFGTTGKYSQILKEVSVPAVSHGQCQSMLRNTRLGSTFTLHNSFNCAGGNGEDACTGDGGSPLVCPNPSNPNEYVQMGVVAWGIGCGEFGSPGVYGSIPHTVDWIRGELQKQPKPQGGGFDIRTGQQPSNPRAGV